MTPDTGIIVPPRDEHALAAGILRLAGDDAFRRRLGEGARAHVLRRYSAERLVADIDALYGALL